MPKADEGSFPSLVNRARNIIDIDEAKTQLSRLVERAARGEAFVIAKGGKPLVKVTAVEPKRFGLLKGEIKVPADFDRMGARKIAALFGITA